MNADVLMFILFIIFLSIVMYLNRKKLHIEKIFFPLLYIIMYRTKFGLGFMDRSAKRFSRFWKWFGYTGIVVGFIGMIFSVYGLIRNIYNLWYVPGTNAGIGLVLPGVKIPGLPYLGFWHWIIAIFILALVHEFSHGILARLYNLKIKSSGLAVLGVLLPIIPAAFVEPDEKKLFKKKKKEQLSVLAAGPFSNLVLAGIIFLISLFLFTPLFNLMYNFNGVVVYSTVENYPMNLSGVNAGEKIISINNMNVLNVDDFKKIMSNVKAGENILLKTNKTDYNIKTIENPKEEGKAYLGVSVVPEKYELKFKNLRFLTGTISWFAMLFSWIFLLNFLIALVNLLPLPVVDGGRMMYLAVLGLVKDEKTAKKIFSVIAFLCLLLIILNIPKVLGFVKLLFG